jgi:2-methylisocitrate lyase-like PEP mutase family enzyme
MRADDLRTRFLALHHGDGPLLVPNPWDAGSARLLAHLGFSALATTSSGFAGTLGRLDGDVTPTEALAHAAALAAAVDIPVTADLEQGFADEPAEVAATITRAVASDLAGGSIEDWSGGGDGIVYPLDQAADRVRAAAEAAHAGRVPFVLTGRAENLIRGHVDLGDTIDRLQAYQEAGADVLYAPGLMAPADIEAVLSSVDRPVNVLVRPGGPTVGALAELGVHRISVGGALSYVATAAVATAARELLEDGTLGFMDQVAEGLPLARAAYR